MLSLGSARGVSNVLVKKPATLRTANGIAQIVHGVQEKDDSCH